MCTIAGCESKLRTLRAAAPHYPVLPTLLACMQLLCTICMCHLFLEILSLGKFLIQQECTKIRIFNPRCACAARVMVLGLSVCMCVCVCLSVYLILEPSATKRHVNGTLVFSAASARKIIWLKWLRSGKRNRHLHGQSFVTQPIN